MAISLNRRFSNIKLSKSNENFLFELRSTYHTIEYFSCKYNKSFKSIQLLYTMLYQYSTELSRILLIVQGILRGIPNYWTKFYFKKPLT